MPVNQSDYFFGLDSNITSFQYPILEAESMIEGKYYAWQLKRSYQTTVGEEALFSEIFVFFVNFIFNYYLRLIYVLRQPFLIDQLPLHSRCRQFLDVL